MDRPRLSRLTRRKCDTGAQVARNQPPGHLPPRANLAGPDRAGPAMDGLLVGHTAWQPILKESAAVRCRAESG
jgi:hypothetical protein